MKRSLFILIVLSLLLSISLIINFINRKDAIRDDQDSNKTAGTITDISLNVTQLSFSEWNTPSGLPYTQVPGANLGTTSFQLIHETQMAFLCNSTSEIIITSLSDGKSTHKFPVSFAPRDFVFDNGNYYVLSEYMVTVYDETGKELQEFPFPTTYRGVERLMRVNDATYLLLPSGNSLMVENCGTPVQPFEYAGVITGTGQFVRAQITGTNSYSVEIISSEDNILKKTFTTGNKVAGVFVVGATENRIILDVQTFISENPITVERMISAITLDKSGPQAVAGYKKVPDCYYVISNKDLYVGSDGHVYHMVTSPPGVFVFSLTEAKSGIARDYPTSLADTIVQTNDQLLKLD